MYLPLPRVCVIYRGNIFYIFHTFIPFLYITYPFPSKNIFETEKTVEALEILSPRNIMRKLYRTRRKQEP